MKRSFNPAPAEPAVRCIACGHLASEHGRTGTRPCLAMVGELLDRHFCPCDELQIEASAVTRQVA